MKIGTAIALGAVLGLALGIVKVRRLSSSY
jgi:hypothetical protein